MATILPAETARRDVPRVLPPARYAAGAAVLVAAAWSAAAWLPLGVSVIAVFLFAAPHNWMECRYFLQRMPARWGPLRSYYLWGICGAIALALSSLLLPSVARRWSLGGESWRTLLAVWNSALVVWVVGLAHLRRREKLRKGRTVSRRDAEASSDTPSQDVWPLLYSLGWVAIAFAWLMPLGWSLTLVYLHPLIALWFLDRELLRRNIAWHAAYRRSLWLLPPALAALWCLLWNKPDLPGDDLVSLQISRHAGGSVVPGLSTHLLVATHVFLEMLHYAVWILAIPSIGLSGQPWQLDRIPVARKSAVWRRAVSVVLLTGAALVVAFWGGFLVNYPATRDLYFSVAVLHVLAEAPFLIRLL